MKVPDKFPEGCKFWASFSGDEFAEFPDGKFFKLADDGESLESWPDLPKGCAPISEGNFLNCAKEARAFLEWKMAS
jgi:hypothetical protein